MADDDIIELTEIVKEGRALVQGAPETGVSQAPAAVSLPDDEPPLPADFHAESVAPAPEAPPAPSAQVPDFGADLDALLQNYDNPAASAEPAPVAAPGGAVATPIANQAAGDRTVDPNEELDLPPLSDLDALLEELGIQDNGSPENATPQGAPSPGDDLDAVRSPGLASPAGRVAPAPSAPESVALADDDGIDLNELDALLDNVLASAPKQHSAPAAAPKPAQAEPAAPAPKAAAPVHTAVPLADVDVTALQAEVAALRAELEDLRANIGKYAAAAAAKVIREELAAIAADLE